VALPTDRRPEESQAVSTAWRRVGASLLSCHPDWASWSSFAGHDQRADRTGTRNAHEASAQLVLAYDGEHDFVQPDVLLSQRLTCAQHAVDERGDQLVTCHQLAHPRVEFGAAKPCRV
jgi:hypothetical protein